MTRLEGIQRISYHQEYWGLKMNVRRNPIVHAMLMLSALVGCAPSGSDSGNPLSATPSGIGDTSDGSVDVPNLRTDFWPTVVQAFQAVGCYRANAVELPRGFTWLPGGDAFVGFASRDLGTNLECGTASRDCLFKVVYARFSVSRCSEVTYRETFFFATRQERENWVRHGIAPNFQQVCEEYSMRFPGGNFFCGPLSALPGQP